MWWWKCLGRVVGGCVGEREAGRSYQRCLVMLLVGLDLSTICPHTVLSSPTLGALEDEMNLHLRIPAELAEKLDTVREAKRGETSIRAPSRHAMVLLALSRYVEAELAPLNQHDLFEVPSINAGLDRLGTTLRRP